MEKKLIYLFFTVLLSCNNRQEAHYFSYYDKENIIVVADTIKFLIDKNIFQINILSKGSSELITFKERQYSDGIYRNIDSSPCVKYILIQVKSKRC